MDTKLIRIGRENIALFVPLYLDVFNSPPWNDGWTKEVAIERLQTFADFPRFRGVGMCRAEQPVALVLGWGERWVKGWTFHIKEMCVDKNFQNQGLGKTLLATFEEQLVAEGFTSANLQTGEAAPARGFYGALGYKPFAVVSMNKRLI